MTAYLDASVLLPTIVQEAASGAVDTFLLRACSTIIESVGSVEQALSLCFVRQLCWRADALICQRCLTTGDELLISDFSGAEVASAISRLVRTKFLTPTDAATRLAAFDTWRAAMTVTPAMAATDARLADVFVRHFELMLRAPDALHVAICRRLDLTLVTLDRRLAHAARALGLRVAMPGI